jgi:transmembrane sensor
VGECFFEVTKSANRPFIINSNSIITKVWGTSFRIRDINKCEITDVSVVTGRVSVKIKDKTGTITPQLEEGEVMLYPNQKVTFHRKERILKTQKESNQSSVHIWNRVNLNFEGVPLKTIIPVLNSKYNARIKVENAELNNYMLTADFDGFNLPEILDALKKSLNIQYEMKDATILLK